LYPDRVQRAVAIAAGLAGAVVGVAAAAGPNGRVVRVERSRGGAHRTPRVCQVGTAGTGECWGVAPEVGETATLIDQNGTLGTIRVTTVEEKRSPHCQETRDWRFTFVHASRAPDRSDSSPIALFDVDLYPGRSKLIRSGQPPDTRPGVSVWNAVDGDGDGIADFVVTAYPCDDQGDPPTRRMRPSEFICVDYWAGGAPAWRLLRHDQFSACGP
jgi:hypothetical protein